MAQLFANNAAGALAGSINGAATTLTLTTGKGALFPNPTGGDYFYATLIGLDANGLENAWEIVKCTARSTDQLTVVRGQEGTTATSWNAGTRVELRLTAAGIAAIPGEVTLTGTQTLTNKTLTGPTETVFVVTGTTPAITASNGSIQTWTLTANSTPTYSINAGQSVILMVTAGAYSVTWPTTSWSKVGGSGVAPTLTATGATTVVLWKVGTTTYGALLGSV